MADAASFDARVDGLYALPLDEFVAARKRIAAELKREGAAAEARSFAGLAKPTLSAWLTNQTVRQAPELVRELVAATDAVAAAQRKHPAAHGHGAAPDFPSAVAAQRRIVARLAEEARAVVAKLGPGGANSDVVDRVENNLRWGAIAGADREALTRGRLLRDVAAPGFAGFGEAAADDEPRPKPTVVAAPDTKADAKVEAQSAREHARAAAEAERERRREVARREAALREAKGETARARRELTHAEHAQEVADQRVAAAEAALASAREARDAAEKQRTEAADELALREAAESSLRG